MKYRDHRGGLAESMATVVHLDPTIEALAAHLSGGPLGPEVIHPEDVKVEPYGYDARTGWATHIVTVNGAVRGFTDCRAHPKYHGPDNDGGDGPEEQDDA